MTNILAFIKWQIKKWDAIDQYLISLSLLGLLFSLLPNGIILTKVIAFLLLANLAFGLLWMICYMVKRSYNRYLEEKQTLLTRIKNSDK